MNRSLIASVLVTVMAVAGCGGGDDDETPPASGGNAPGTTYPAGSPEALAFTTTNSERDHCGFGTLAQSAALDRSATAHMSYMVLNNLVAHTEEPGKPGFTGVNPANRAVVAGYPSSAGIGEVISFPLFAPGDSADAVRRLFAAPYHGQLMIDSARDVGIDSQPFQGVVGLTMEFGFPFIARPPAVTSVRTYPCEGTTGVLAFNRNESPSPLPSQQNPSWGQPIIVRGPDDLRLGMARITGPGGTVALQVIYGDGQTPDPEQQFTRGWATVLPVPLATNTQYTVNLNWTAGGQAGSSSFRFTTGSQ
ncbi:hypothetical protein GCM10027034_22700 [Ramlibacter solisilvae]|uniref:SCP domain-containing protein n=1 Tax=Ramlibacter tataouinensis TaxID=94132 RepID=A0A127JPZ4_9BURK|nr:CAP domain-containing protein [Ramlibacter tataouinensis]AMO21995.1 hypothetical protein UC35_02780 [Ramlibacter tataouinensis]